jgi:hypothetical protein
MAGEKKDRYVIAKGVSFVGNKKHYVEGDDIDESAFKKPEQFQKLVKAGKIVIAPPEAEKKEKAGKGNKGGGGDKTTREALEKAAIDSGLFSKEQLTGMKDEELEQILKDTGALG